MSANFQWANGFDNSAEGGNNPEQYGWFSRTKRVNIYPVGGFLRGRGVKFRSASYDYPCSIYRGVTDSSKMVLAFALLPEITTSYNTKTRFGIRGTTTPDEVSIEINDVAGVSVINLYKNGSLADSGSTNMDVGAYMWIEIFIDKNLNTATVKLNDLVTECSTALPTGFVAGEAFIDIRNRFSNGETIDDIVFYDSSDPLGIIKVDGYYATGSVDATFTEGNDGASDDPMETAGQGGYRSSSTSGDRDTFDYTNLLPPQVDVLGIYAVQQYILASGGNYMTDSLKTVFKSGASLNETLHTNLLPYTNVPVFGPMYHNNPDTNTTWTRAEVQAIQTGYEVP